MESDEEYEKSSREKFKKERHDDSYKSLKESRSSKGSLSTFHGRRGRSVSDDDDDYKERKKSYRDSFGRDLRDSRDNGRNRSSYRDNDRKYDSNRGRSSFPSDRDFVRPNYQRRNSFHEEDSRKRSRCSSPPHDSSAPYGKRPRWNMPRELDMEFDPYQPPFPDGMGLMPALRDPYLQGPPPPPTGMMTFKQFLTSQEEDLDEKEAVQKYKEYKVNYKKQQISEFFIAHKDEEWFKTKYHPVDCSKAKEEQSAVAHRRLEAFLDLFKSGWFDFSLDIEHSKKIIRFLDAIVIKLEGGNEEHLSLLDDPESKAEQQKEEVEKESLDKKITASSSPDRKVEKDEEEGEVKSDEETERNEDNKTIENVTSKGSNGAQDLVEQQEDNKQNDTHEGNGIDKSYAEELDYDPPKEQDIESKCDDSDNECNKEEIDKLSESENSSSSSESDNESSSEEPVDVASPDPTDDEDATKGTAEVNSPSSPAVDKTIKENGTKKSPEKDIPKIEELHKTQSIFLRNVPPSVTKKEIENLCKNIPGFLRVSLTDPQPERKFYRRGWVTFKASSDIKKICLDLSYVKLRDVDLGAIVNRELSRRVRTVSGLASDKAAAHSDLKAVFQMIQRLDEHKNLWKPPGIDFGKSTSHSPSSSPHCKEENQEKSDSSLPTNNEERLPSSNPFLANIHDYLVEESDALEMELLGVGNNQIEDTTRKVERDDELIKVLDRLLLYLRVVHSVDFYNHNDYPMEDEMPNRLGLIHVRDSVPDNTSQKEMESYMEKFAKFHKMFSESQAKLPDEEVEQLGRKDIKTETEKFIEANIQELNGNKWMCLISNKKFKAKEFVVKHIYNKHEDKLHEVREMVEYFNNYLQDPRRPQLPNSSSTNSGPNQEMMNSYRPPPPFGPIGFMRPDWAFGGRQPFDRRRRDPRAPIQYYDLDAPREDEFI